MAFLRQWLLIICAFALGGGQLLAATTREERAFATAAAEFKDGIWARAEADFAQFAERYPKSTRLPEAVLFQAQAQFKQGKFTTAIALLNRNLAVAGTLADRYAYWLAEARFAIGDKENLSAAADAFIALTHSFPESPLRLSAVVSAAAAYEKLGNWARLSELLAEKNGVFALAAELDAGNELVMRGRLLLAQGWLAQENFSEALANLNLLNPQTLTPELGWQRAQLLVQVRLAAGDPDAALADTTNLLALARPLGVLRLAESVARHGAVLEKMDRLSDAAAAWAENLKPEAPVEQQKQAVLKIAALAAAQNDFSNATASLEAFLAGFPAASAAGLALLTLGELHLKHFVAQPGATNELAAAHAKFEQFIGTLTNSPLLGRAYLDRGWCHWLDGKVSESGDDFQSAVQKLSPSEDLAVARFKLGDARFAQNDFAGARENYQAVLTDFGSFPAVMPSLGARALYQSLRASLELKDQAAAETALQRLLEVFPNSEMLDNSLLLAGQGFSDFSSPANARGVFRQFQRQSPSSPLLPQVALAVARTFEREQNWAEAIACYDAWLKDFPAHEKRPQAAYARGWATFQNGDEAAAFGQFTNFVAQFPTNELAPLAQWWVADHGFRSGSFIAAETGYENIFQTPAWKGSALFYPAQLMAGRAAMARQGFPDAARYFTGLTADTNCPAAILTQAMFAYGSVLRQWDSPDTNHPFANFELATNVFAHLCAANPTNETGALACSELADCDLQLGALDAATNAYAQVVSSPYAVSGLRSRALVGLGIAMEKKAALLPVAERSELLAQALDFYHDAFYGATDPFWKKKAGLQALPLMVSLRVGDPDSFLTDLEKELPQLKDALEKKRAALKK